MVTCGYGYKKDLIKSGAEFIAADFGDTSVWFICHGLKKCPKGVVRKFFMFPNIPIKHINMCHTGSGKVMGEDL